MEGIRGDYLLVVKGNQPLLRQDIEDVFEASHTYLLELGLKQQDLSSERGVREVTIHGRRVEERVLRASTALCDCYNGYGDHLWPGLGQVLQAGATGRCYRQVLQMKRAVMDKDTGRTTTETAYAITAITSLSPERATPTQLLHAWREHWHIENKLHWVRDVTFNEDRSTVRSGGTPQVMAALRNTAIGLMRVLGATNIAKACRHYAARPDLTLAALGCLSDFE